MDLWFARLRDLNKIVEEDLELFIYDKDKKEFKKLILPSSAVKSGIKKIEYPEFIENKYTLKHKEEYEKALYTRQQLKKDIEYYIALNQGSKTTEEKFDLVCTYIKMLNQYLVSPYDHNGFEVYKTEEQCKTKAGYEKCKKLINELETGWKTTLKNQINKEVEERNSIFKRLIVNDREEKEKLRQQQEQKKRQKELERKRQIEEQEQFIKRLKSKSS